MVLNESINSKNIELIESNRLIERQKRNLEKVNGNLEEIVKRRTLDLTEQNNKLIKYSHYNAHVFRAPICRIRGLLELLLLQNVSQEEKEKILKYLIQTSNELIKISEDVSAMLDKNQNIFTEEDSETDFEYVVKSTNR
jgi:light-regulated signal transduction histidine kinase (bacteriophytochrome)